MEEREHRITKEDRKKAGRALLGRQTILMFSAAMLLAASAGYMTYAWYTRTVTTGNASFEIAQWDFSANHNIGDFTIDIAKYANLRDNKVAPGTNGSIPIELSTMHSDTAVDYALVFRMMNPGELSEEQKEIQTKISDRIKFYYKDPTTGKDTLMTVDDRGAVYQGTLERKDQVTKSMTWKWLYECPVKMDDMTITIKNDDLTHYPDGYLVITGDGSPYTVGLNRSNMFVNQTADDLKKDTELVFPEAGSGEALLNGERILNYKGQVCTYYNELGDDIRTFLCDECTDPVYVSTYKPQIEAYQKKLDENNNFDTEIGNNPDKYVRYLTIQVSISGVQAVPELQKETPKP